MGKEEWRGGKRNARRQYFYVFIILYSFKLDLTIFNIIKNKGENETELVILKSQFSDKG